MAIDRTFHIRPVLDGQTLAAGLRHLVRDLSWADAKRLIGGRQVQVNGNLSLDESRRLKAGDVVKLFEHARAPVPTAKDVRVLHIDADLIVVDKPAGITTLRHAEERGWDDRRKQRQPTLDEVLQQMLPGLLAGGRPPVQADRRHAPIPPGGAAAGRPRIAHPLHGRPGPKNAKPAGRRTGGHDSRQPTPPPAKNLRVRPVHRLDRDTSGLMLFALSPRAEAALVDMFKGHDIRRAYRAVVHGRLGERTVESWFVRDRGDGLRGSTPRGAKDPEAKHAVTHFRPVEHLGDAYTVVECRLETGRTHQIRIHLSDIGHPLCGEKVYTRPTPQSPPVRDDSGAPRHALHSAELEFTHPLTGQSMKFAAPPPADLARWLQWLREAAGS